VENTTPSRGAAGDGIVQGDYPTRSGPSDDMFEPDSNDDIVEA
jgi:hypothetical protein